jgi:acyl-coenzyme A synthetase/AMP-(fatty) acid ligase
MDAPSERWLATDELDKTVPRLARTSDPARCACPVQYTSGSTASPKVSLSPL